MAPSDGRLVLVVNTKTLDSSYNLIQLNLSLRSLRSSTMVVIKPLSGGIKRAEDRMFPTSSILHIADRISKGVRRLPKLLRTQVRLLCMHKSGKVVSNGPPALPSLKKQLMLSTEVDRCRGGHCTGSHRPGPVKAAPLKRLQPGAKKGRPTGEELGARDTTRGTTGAADIAADMVVALADEAAQAVADVVLPSSIPAFITTNGTPMLT